MVTSAQGPTTATLNPSLRGIGEGIAAGAVPKKRQGTSVSSISPSNPLEGVELPPRVQTASLPTLNTTSPTLDAIGAFRGFVQTPKGDVWVAIKPANTEAGRSAPPLVYTGGLATWGDRVDGAADTLRNETGRSTIGIVLPGQAETLDRDVNRTGGKSLKQGFTDESQAEAVVQVLDALGVKKPVDVAGLSYGGAVAAALKKNHPERVNQTFLIAPHVRSVSRFDGREGSWQLAQSNPVGRLAYRASSQALLNATFALFSTFREHPVEFLKGVGELTHGVDRLQLENTVAGQEDVHILVAEGDRISPPKYNRKAIEAAGRGSTLTMAPDSLRGQHDLIRAGLPEVAKWIAGIAGNSTSRKSAGPQ
jgi:pimeloyl-ACP methyl ester carboxylesterase